MIFLLIHSCDVGHGICLLGEKFMIFVGEVEEWLLHPRVVLGVALEVLEGQLSGGVQAHLGRHQSPLCEVRLVAQQDSRHRLQPRCLLQLVQPGPGGGECLLPGDVIHDHHQGAALPQSPHHVVIDGPPGTVDHHQLHGVVLVHETSMSKCIEMDLT